MARLSANGREILRLAKESAGDGDLTTWERRTFAVMTNRWILQKRDVRFAPDRFEPNGRKHSYGWKRYMRLRDVTPERLDKIVERHQAAGWKVTRKFAGVR